MHFTTRNAYYLRISGNTILPLYLYLDEQHVDWMSERILQLVLEDLRLRIPDKLMNEAEAFFGPRSSSNTKQSSLDVHRGEGYQFGYFLRTTDPHAVIVKTRRFVAAPQTQRVPQAQSPPQSLPRATTPKRKRGHHKRKAETPGKTGKKRKTKGKQRANSEEEEEAIILTSEEEDAIQELVHGDARLPTRRSTRSKKAVMDGYRETGEEDMDSASMDVDAPIPMDPPLSHDPHLVTMDETDETMGTVKTEETELHLQISTAPDSLLAGTELAQASFEEPLLVDDEEEQKAKPILKMSYQAFNIHGQCLCVIVEPCPLIRSATKPMSLVREGLVGPQAPRIVSSDQLPSGSTSLRERTPLFLPDDDGERGVTPAPLQRVLPPAPLFNQEPSSDDDESIGGMFALSQVLQSVGGYAAGTAEDDDEIDGAVFFGDADETREL